MGYRKIVQYLFPNPSNQAPPLPGQIHNNAGGYYYPISDWERLDRFLILGTESGTYYTSPIALTRENTEVVQRLLASDGKRVVERIVQISASGRAPKNRSALFALALAAAALDVETRQVALKALPQVARTGTHVLEFAEFIHGLRGWGRSLRQGLGHWLLEMPVEKLSLQAVKYAQRKGWALRDILRLAHPKTTEAQRAVLFDWLANPEKAEAVTAACQNFRLIQGKYLAKEAKNAAEVAAIVRQYSLPREAVPNTHLNSALVWDALLVDMPMTAMLRHLGKMTQVGLLTPMSEAAAYVAKRLRDAGQLKQAKIHPIQILLALRTYAQGRGMLGSLAWEPVPAIVAALDEAFDRAFSDVQPTCQRILVGIDVSGSMQGTRCAGSPVLYCVEAAVAMAMLLVRSEKFVHTIAFDTATHHLTMTPKQRLDDMVKKITQWGGGTDLSLPIAYAFRKGMWVDAFVILTDNETWAGSEHAAQALHRYRQSTNPAAKLVVLAASANHGRMIASNDPLSLGIAGFDAAVPELITGFIRGELN